MASMAPMMSNPQSEKNNDHAVNPLVGLWIMLFIVGVCLLAKAVTCVQACMRDDWELLRATFNMRSDSFKLRNRGLEATQLDALSLVRRADLGQRDDYECPVCLMNFEPEENLRLLPSGKHVFHQDCIDLWFDSHSTCPLCRAIVLGDDVERPNVATPVVVQVVPRVFEHSIDEVSENSDSDTEVHNNVMRRDAPLEDSRTGSWGVAPQPSAMITREDEQSSASGALSRNSESFERAARIVEVDASTAAEAAPESNPMPLAESTIVRWSSLLVADLVLLRNLLMGADQNANTASGSSLWWSARTRSLERLAEIRDPAAQSEFHSSREEWVTVDLEEGKATPELAEPSTSTSSQGEFTKGKWSDGFSLSGLKSIAIPSRSTSDAS